MILKCDQAQLEWRSYLQLSQDKVGIDEIIQNLDVHTINKDRFNLPTRLVSKTFLFRWIYRGSAWAYANDFNFAPTSSDPNFWQSVIDEANAKYKILYKYQNSVIARAQRGEVFALPTGREYKFSLSKDKNGKYFWDEKQIVNYINQGFGADIMQMTRVILRKRLRKYDPKLVLPINTVHDDVEFDVDNDPKLLYNICIELEDAVASTPANMSKYYGMDFNVPLKGEASFGKNLLEMQKFDRTKGEEQFYAN